jgi:hypothetical protein
VSGDGEPGVLWRTSRPLVMAGVLTLHVALLALLLAASQDRNVAAAEQPPVLLMNLPPPKVPKVRAENIRPQRLSTDIAIALAPPLLDSSIQSGSAAAPDGHGPAVNWTAEAHRAVRAFEIRRDQTPSSALSVSPSLDEWWRREHRAGDQFKTEGGDWIVWINADCYQVASWHGTASTVGAPAPATVCRAAGGTQRSQ